MFVVAFVFPGGSVEFSCTLPVHTPMLIFRRASGVFLKALVPVLPSGVCFPLHFAVFVLAHAPEHAFSLCW